MDTLQTARGAVQQLGAQVADLQLQLMLNGQSLAELTEENDRLRRENEELRSAFESMTLDENTEDGVKDYEDAETPGD